MPIFEECVQRGTRALQPLAIDVTEGTLYFVTDENITERSNGAVWQNYSPTGTMSGSIAQQPTGLGPAQAGLLFQVLAPYFHTCRWNGTAWEFAPGDCGNGYLTERVVAPQAGEGLALCNGAATDYLKVGGTSLTVQAFTTPNVVGAYLKGAAAYNGVVNPAVGGTSGAAAGTTALDGPIATGAADRALIANTGGATATGACDRVLSATTTAQPEYYTVTPAGSMRAATTRTASPSAIRVARAARVARTRAAASIRRTNITRTTSAIVRLTKAVAGTVIRWA
jgi:hypothetical protein